MRRASILLAFLAIQAASSFAAQIDIAILRFPEPKGAAQLDSEFAGQSLAETTNADRTLTTVPGLKGATVLFAQTLPAAPSFSSSTRLGNTRADCEFTLKNGILGVKITLTEGVDAGLRKFSTRTYQGSAPLPPGNPRTISIRTVTSKTKSVMKDKSEVRETTTTHAIVAQLR